MDLFFTYETDLPDNTGFELFHWEHLTILLICLAFTMAGLVFYRQLKKKGAAGVMLRFRRILTAALPIIIIIRTVYIVICGAKLIYELPLHLCSITGIVCFIYEFCGNRMSSFMKGVLGQTLYSLGLPGAVMALVFTDGTAYPPVHFITIESSLFHTLIILYVLILLTDSSVIADIRKAWMAIIFLVVTVPPIMIFDRFLNTNYMFLLGPSAGSPLMPAYVRFGYPGYLIAYALAAVTVIYLINAVGMITDHSKHR